MLTITTETRRFVLKENEEQSEKKFNEIIRKFLELPEGIADDKKPQETENANRQQEERPSGHKYKGFLYIHCPECGRKRNGNGRYIRRWRIMDKKKVREAIAWMGTERKIHKYGAYKSPNIPKEQIDMIEEYYNLAIEALEKQLPKEAKKIDIIDPVTYQTNVRFYLCKCCEEACAEYMEYCPGCGQKLDWSEKDE